MAKDKMTSNLPGITIAKEDLAKFNLSVYGEKGKAQRKQVVEFCKEAIKIAFEAHNIPFEFHSYKKEEEE